MKRNHILLGVFALGTLFSSCTFLDKMPDSRTELNRADKIERLLVTAYPTLMPMGFVEHRTDNVEDNGPKFEDSNLENHEGFYWESNSGTDWDTETNFWSTCYDAIMTANQALESIEELGSPRELEHSRGEALLCRAYTHFLLVNVFAQAYNGRTGQTDIGVPYFLTPEKSIKEQAKRLSVAEVYAQIDRDLQAGLPLIDDERYVQPMYHFTTRAAKAFATQFYCYYEKWDKAKKYADEVLGTGAVAGIRDVAAYSRFTNVLEVTLAYIDPRSISNIMLQTTRSLWGRGLRHVRFAHSGRIAQNETYRSGGGWGHSLIHYDLLYGGAERIFTPKLTEIFEITNIAAQTGQPHIVAMPFDVDKVLLWRAEARVMLKDYDGAAADLSAWYLSKGGKAGDVATITKAYSTQITNDTTEEEREVIEKRLKTIAKPLHPKFDLEAGTQTLMMQAVLHARRVLTVHEGTRWDDIKRFGIEITHTPADGKPMVLRVDDHRRALQIPASIRNAGMQGNPGY